MKDISSCIECDCYDEDFGCTMPSVDKSYACPLNSPDDEEEDKMIEFFLPMIPPTVTHQEKEGNWNARTMYEPQELKAARAKLEAHLAKYAPAHKFTGPLRLVTKWCFPRGKHRDGEYKITKPDTDNLQKLLKDVMTDLGYWKDDALVVSEITEKFWAEIPGIYIKISELEG